MLATLSVLAESFPYTSRTKRLTLHTSFSHSRELTHNVYELISARSCSSQRIKAKISNGPNALFLKSSALNSWKSKLRLTLGIQRSKKNGAGYDWPLEELINSMKANNLDIPSARIFGFGYVRHRLGWIVEFFLITEQLISHVDGTDWLATEGNDPKELISRALTLILRLHECDFIHLDPWIANFMINPNNLDDIRIVDLENCILAPTQHFLETLGIQFGILYRRVVCDYVAEEHFDELVKHTVMLQEVHCDERFWRAYMISKREKIARKSRRRTPLTGKIAPG